MNQRCESILIVEDDPDIRDTLRELLLIEGYTAYAVANGREGLNALKTIPKPCLIFLDLMMPVMNGWEFLDARKDDVVLKTLPIVIVSALQGPTPLSGGNLPEPSAEFLKKPVDMDALLRIVESHCGPASSCYEASSERPLVSSFR